MGRLASIVFAMTCSGCFVSIADDSDSGAPIAVPYAPSDSSVDATLPEGFVRYEALGSTCKAAYSKGGASLPALSFIPCPSGVSGCERVNTEWFGSGTFTTTSRDGLEFQVALDASGNASKLMQFYHSGNYVDLGKAIVHDWGSSKALAAWINIETRYTSGCRLRPIVSEHTAWIVARAQSSSGLKVSHGSLSDLSTTTAFLSVAADDTIWNGNMVASDDVLALEQSDGKLVLIYAANNRIWTGYGPNMRVWLHSVIGSDVIVYNDQTPSSTQYLRLSSDGQFEAYPVMGHALSINASNSAWFVNVAPASSTSAAESTLQIWKAPYDTSGREPSTLATMVTVVKGVSAKPVNSTNTSNTILTNGNFAFAIRNSTSEPPVAVVTQLDSALHTTKQIIPPDGNTFDMPTLLAADGQYVWYSFDRWLGDGQHPVERLRVE